MCRTCQSSLPLTGATVFKVYEEPAEEIVPEEPPEEVLEEPEPAPPPKGTWQVRWSVHTVFTLRVLTVLGWLGGLSSVCLCCFLSRNSPTFSDSAT